MGTLEKPTTPIPAHPHARHLLVARGWVVADWGDYKDGEKRPHDPSEEEPEDPHWITLIPGGMGYSRIEKPEGDPWGPSGHPIDSEYRRLQKKADWLLLCRLGENAVAMVPGDRDVCRGIYIDRDIPRNFNVIDARDPDQFSTDRLSLLADAYGLVEVLGTRVDRVLYPPGFDLLEGVEEPDKYLDDDDGENGIFLWGAKLDPSPEVPEGEIWVCGDEGGLLRRTIIRL